MINIETKTSEKFLSDIEINEINRVMSTTEVEVNYSGLEHGTHFANYYYMKLYDHEPHKQLADILLPKIKSWLHNDIYIDDCHIIETIKPYGIHSDVLTPVPMDGYTEAWTVIIPLDDFNTNTFIFEERCRWTKSVIEWVNTEKVMKVNRISDNMYNTYFNHTNREEVRFLTIHDFFPWRKGWANATSRERFHCSDNYPAKGLKSKRAIVMWTSIPKK